MRALLTQAEHMRRGFGGDATAKRLSLFADYLLPKRVLIEMKKRGENLKKHYVQLEEYWKSLESHLRPRYAILCDFDEFWIYDFQNQFYDPVDKVAVTQLTGERRAALEFLVPDSRRNPVFKDNRVEVTKDAAYPVGRIVPFVARSSGDANSAALYLAVHGSAICRRCRLAATVDLAAHNRRQPSSEKCYRQFT